MEISFMYFQSAYAHQLEHYHIFVENGWFKKDWSVKTNHDFSFFIFSLILQKIMKTMRIIITLHFSVLLIRNLLLWLTTSHIVWMLHIDLFFFILIFLQVDIIHYGLVFILKKRNLPFPLLLYKDNKIAKYSILKRQQEV